MDLESFIFKVAVDPFYGTVTIVEFTELFEKKVMIYCFKALTIPKK